MGPFVESEHVRDRGGRFASTGPAAEAADVQLAPAPGSAPAWEDARAALQPDPDPKPGHDYRTPMVAAAIHPGLDEAELGGYIQAMRSKNADHELAHRTAARMSDERIAGTDYNRLANAQRNPVRASTYLSEDFARNDPRTAPAFRAMTPHLSEADRSAGWDKLVAASDHTTHVARTAQPRFTDESDRQVAKAMDAQEDLARDLHADHPAFRFGRLQAR